MSPDHIRIHLQNLAHLLSGLSAIVECLGTDGGDGPLPPQLLERGSDVLEQMLEQMENVSHELHTHLPRVSCVMAAEWERECGSEDGELARVLRG